MKSGLIVLIVVWVMIALVVGGVIALVSIDRLWEWFQRTFRPEPVQEWEEYDLERDGAPVLDVDYFCQVARKKRGRI